jgi:lathosterol oxidase
MYFYITSFATHLFFHDLWFYISHLYLHTHRGYHYIHKFHHYKKDIKFIDAYRSHILETPIQSAGIFIPLLWIPLDIKTLAALCVFINIRTMMLHDPRCTWLIGNHHLLHHKYPNTNYGDYWIDRAFNTQCTKKDEIIHGVICL